MGQTKKRSQIGEWILAFLIAFLIAFFLRLFIFEVNVIPSSSMAGSLVNGDYILLSKINYGPRLPITPVAIPFTHKEIPFVGGKSYSEKYLWDYNRLPGLTGIQINDVLVFNYPLEDGIIDRKEYFVKRCMALPGQEFKLVNGKPMINGDAAEIPGEIQYSYSIISKNQERLGNAWMNKWGINEGGRRNTKGLYQFVMTPEKAARVANDTLIKRIEKVNIDKGLVLDSEPVFPFNSSVFPWNVDNYGPIKVPETGDTININKKNINLYKRLIEQYEKHELKINGDSISIDGKITDQYVVEMDYYFVMGDNRHMSSDSRFWGFVPEDHIIGKAILKIFSVKPGFKWYHKGAIRWGRIFRPV